MTFEKSSEEVSFVQLSWKTVSKKELKGHSKFLS